MILFLQEAFWCASSLNCFLVLLTLSLLLSVLETLVLDSQNLRHRHFFSEITWATLSVGEAQSGKLTAQGHSASLWRNWD